jgi:hypothetical protein
LLCLLALSAAPGQAVTLRFTGVIDDVFDPTGIGNPIEIGSTFTAVVSFSTDVSAAPEAGGSPGQLLALNVLTAPPASYVLNVGPWTITAGATPVYPTPSIEVNLGWNPSDGDFWDMRTTTQSIPGSGIDFVGEGGLVLPALYLQGPNGTLDPTLRLSDIPLDLADWAEAYLFLEYWLDDSSHDTSGASGTITSIEVIPEPATALLFGAGLAAIAAARRPRSSTAKRRFPACAAALAIALWPLSSDAVPVEVVFRGVVTEVFDDSGLTGGAVSGGTPFLVKAVYDADAPSSPPVAVVNGVASYNFVSTPPGVFSAAIGPWSFDGGPFDSSGPPGEVGFTLNLFDRSGVPPDNSADVVTWSTSVDEIDGLDVVFDAASFHVILGGGEGILGSLALADIPLDLAAWESAQITLFGRLDPEGDASFSLIGNITSLTVATVPEPATAALLALGLAVLPALRRTRP